MNRADESDDEGNDPVVREFDVYVTSMADLTLLQFPLRPVYSDCPHVTAAKFKPKNKAIELEVPFDTSIFAADNYDNRPTHQKLASSQMDQTTCQAVAVIRDGEMHLTPLQEILQVKPSFDDIKSREVTEDMSEDEEEIKKVPIQQVHIKRKENERAESARKHSYMHKINAEKAESWVALQVRDIASETCTEKFEDLYHSPQ